MKMQNKIAIFRWGRPKNYGFLQSRTTPLNDNYIKTETQYVLRLG